MKFLIRGEKIEVTEAMKDYATTKLTKLEKYLNDIEQVDVKLLVKIKNHIHKVEVTIPLKNFILRAEEEGKDFYETIDLVEEKLERQIIKNKKRMQNKMHKERPIFSDFGAFENSTDEAIIVKRKNIEIKPMDEEEAILQLELIGHQFYLYKDINTLKYAVIYKRKDGNYGVIEEN